VAGRGVNNDSRIVVVAHEFGVGGLELSNQAVENFRQRFVRRIKLVAQFLRDRCARHDVVARFVTMALKPSMFACNAVSLAAVMP